LKLRLGHAAFGSMLMPELIFIKLAGWRLSVAHDMSGLGSTRSVR
jgi:hypothetical protein